MSRTGNDSLRSRCKHFLKLNTCMAEITALRYFTKGWKGFHKELASFLDELSHPIHPHEHLLGVCAQAGIGNLHPTGHLSRRDDNHRGYFDYNWVIEWSLGHGMMASRA